MGTFRSTCIQVMGVLRDNKDSLLAMLEAFVYDPLIGWKIMNATDQEGHAISVDEKFSNNSLEGTHFTEDEDGEKNNPQLVEAGTTAGEHGIMRRQRASQPSEEHCVNPAPLNEQALKIMGRIKMKLSGKDPTHDESAVHCNRHVGFILPHDDNKKNTRVGAHLKNSDGAHSRNIDVGSSSQRNSSSSSSGAGEQKVFDHTEGKPVKQQVDELITQAQSHANLAQMFIGWCAFW
eukprot:CAMPEP_0185777138 /NCGR_PEP_ID=MMETSP1174-20130828/88411_1 /TAXON_ID=35687 /ORGANISM="Dictyocha speculum, Strain CCMP1381" /LENGTH=233 /DNA_ID=CAMNT_0028465413 /DNA_START=53 /DNA_END=754 /DNA_ORIENTATION=-